MTLNEFLIKHAPLTKRERELIMNAWTAAYYAFGASLKESDQHRLQGDSATPILTNASQPTYLISGDGKQLIPPSA